MRHRRTPEGVAATVEQAFPALDNHLINAVQFAADPSDRFKQAYVKLDIPGWSEVDVRAMKDTRAHRRASLAAGIAAALLLAPWLLAGRAWPTAAYRILNPFAGRPARQPDAHPGRRAGDTSLPQGHSL